MSHTPGPWKIYTWAEHLPHAGRPASIGDSNNLSLEAQNICQLEHIKDEAEAWANAKLIAAAPKLLKALRNAVYTLYACRRFGYTPAIDECMHKANAVIVEATNEETNDTE